MRSQSILAVAFAALAAAMPNPQGDGSIELLVSLWSTGLDCPKPASGLGTGATATVTGNGCVNKELRQGGSALVRASTASSHQEVAAYSEPDCKGKVVYILEKGECSPFADFGAKSWKSGWPGEDVPT